MHTPPPLSSTETPLHQPIMSSAGNTKMIDDSVPAADAIV
ncbi:Uncharacterised protein [Mycobacterium tuberculosis]|nr:Uncharacterised protein [Mycobacterium tuberculosis]